MASDRIIYWVSGSAPCWRALIALEEKGLQFQDKLISFDKKEHKSEEITKLNERGQIPIFRDGKSVVCESVAIMDFVEDAYKSSGTQLIPSDKEENAKTRQLRAEISQNFQLIIVLPLMYYHFQTKEEDLDQSVLKQRYEKAREELKIWESKVTERKRKKMRNEEKRSVLQRSNKDHSMSGGWLVGNKFTMADIELIVALSVINRFGCKLKKFPKLNKYYENAKTRPSVEKFKPPHWKEGDGKPFLSALDD